MKKLIIAALCLALAVPVKANTIEVRRSFGVVLDNEGNGLELDPVERKPIHPYYNYISYGSLNAQPGQYIITYEILNPYGECESREDYYADIPAATPAEIAEFNSLAKKGIYEMNATITETGRNQIVFVTDDGNIWSETGYNLRRNQRIHVIFYDNGTETKRDDQVMQIQHM